MYDVNRYQKLVNIIDNLNIINNSYIKVDVLQILHNLSFLNNVIFKTYKIFKLDIPEEHQIKLLVQLRDPNNKCFLNIESSKKIIKLYKHDLIQFYDNIYKNIEKYQKGGNNSNLNNKIDVILNEISNNPKIIIKKKKILKIINFEEKKQILKNIVNSGNNDKNNTMEWIFFPLYKLENLPVIGFMFEIPLDIIGIMIDCLDIIIILFTPFLLKLTKISVTMAASVPYVGTMLAPINIILSVGGDNIKDIMSAFNNIVGLIINIQRKQFGLAYISALSIIPYFPEFMDSLLTLMTTINKYLDKGEFNSLLVEVFSSVTIEIIKILKTNPNLLKNVDKIWDNIIFPNLKKLNLFKKIPEFVIRNIFIVNFSILEIFLSEINENVSKNQKKINQLLDLKNIERNI